MPPRAISIAIRTNDASHATSALSDSVGPTHALAEWRWGWVEESERVLGGMADCVQCSYCFGARRCVSAETVGQTGCIPTLAQRAEWHTPHDTDY